MEVATDTLGFLNQKLKFDKECQQISVVIFAKDTNSFTYVLLYICPYVRVLRVLEGFAILMRNLKSVVQNIKTVLFLPTTNHVK